MKSVTDKELHTWGWTQINTGQIDANFAAHETEIAELKRRLKKAEWTMEQKLLTQNSIQHLIGRVQGLEAAIESHAQALLSAWGTQREAEIRAEERKRGGNWARKIGRQEAFCRAWGQSVFDSIARHIEEGDPVGTMPPECFWGDDPAIQKAVDTAIEANNKRAVAWINRFRMGWNLEYINTNFDPIDLTKAILNNDEIPRGDVGVWETPMEN